MECGGWGGERGVGLPVVRDLGEKGLLSFRQNDNLSSEIWGSSKQFLGGLRSREYVSEEKNILVIWKERPFFFHEAGRRDPPHPRPTPDRATSLGYGHHYIPV